MVNLCWWYYISKLTEFADTVFFILRKKDSQVTYLHLYHHSLTPLETWICCKFIAGGHGTFSNLINNAVHVVMYGYYMVSAMGPEYQKYLWWKKYLTTIQLVSIFFNSQPISTNLVWIYDCSAKIFCQKLLHDNASRITQASVRDCGFKQADHPLYSPDMAFSDYYLFVN